jgi:PPM family protein phosphatase
VNFSGIGLTDVGKTRDHNEDYIYIDNELGLYIVCDGMGGHNAGEVASKMTSDFVLSFIKKNITFVNEVKKSKDRSKYKKIKSLLSKSIEYACQKIHQLSEQDEDKKGMGTTIVCMLLLNDTAFIAHVGDSRGYLYRELQVHQITEDHSYLNDCVKQGIMTREAAKSSKLQNVITRAVGIQEAVQVDTISMELMKDDHFLLCSDGLSGYMNRKDFAKIIQQKEFGDIPKNLINLANQRGGKDNISAILIKIGKIENNTKKITQIASKKIEILKNISLFKKLTYKEHVKILEVVEYQSTDKNEIIFKEETKGNEMYIILEGSVDIIKENKTLLTLNDGAFFGEMSLIDNDPRSATVQANGFCDLMIIRREPLFKVLKKETRIAVKFFWQLLKNMNIRIRDDNQIILSMTNQLDEKNKDDIFNFYDGEEE